MRNLLLFLPALWPPPTGVDAQQFRGKNEVFFVNLEEGFFGCQVNESSEFLQIFKISNLCDGKSDCYQGSDENQKELKCSSKLLFCFYLLFLLRFCFKMWFSGQFFPLFVWMALSTFYAFYYLFFLLFFLSMQKCCIPFIDPITAMNCLE